MRGRIPSWDAPRLPLQHTGQPEGPRQAQRLFTRQDLVCTTLAVAVAVAEPAAPPPATRRPCTGQGTFGAEGVPGGRMPCLLHCATRPRQPARGAVPRPAPPSKAGTARFAGCCWPDSAPTPATGSPCGPACHEWARREAASPPCPTRHAFHPNTLVIPRDRAAASASSHGRNCSVPCLTLAVPCGRPTPATATSDVERINVCFIRVYEGPRTSEM